MQSKRKSPHPYKVTNNIHGSRHKIWITELPVTKGYQPDYANISCCNAKYKADQGKHF